ncbi:MAG: RDD family protein [Puniceicoccales bacterium]|jgi:uncharacterized RDD family membrane protein YckC|nr:RDD family protein [Puniceicoccales bacterium]
MSEPNPQEPPPLPPPIPLPAEVSIDAFLEDVAEVPALPRPAPLVWRILAYLLDWAIATIAVLLLLKWLIPMEHADGFAELKRWGAEITKEYTYLLKHPANSFAGQIEANRQLMEKASKIPDSIVELFAFAALVQTCFFWGFFTITEYFTQGSSLGKRIFNLRVANTLDYSPPGFFDTLMRSGWKSIFYCSASLPLLIIGVIDAHVPLFNIRRRSWHDMLSRTEVIDACTDPWIPPPREEEE